MGEITITNLNNIIDGYRKRQKILEEEISTLKSRIEGLGQELKELRRRK